MLLNLLVSINTLSAVSAQDVVVAAATGCTAKCSGVPKNANMPDLFAELLRCNAASANPVATSDSILAAFSTAKLSLTGDCGTQLATMLWAPTYDHTRLQAPMPDPATATGCQWTCGGGALVGSFETCLQTLRNKNPTLWNAAALPPTVLYGPTRLFLSNPTNKPCLAKLLRFRANTGGTITEPEKMKRTVQARNMRIGDCGCVYRLQNGGWVGVKLAGCSARIAFRCELRGGTAFSVRAKQQIQAASVDPYSMDVSISIDSTTDTITSVTRRDLRAVEMGPNMLERRQLVQGILLTVGFIGGNVAGLSGTIAACFPGSALVQLQDGSKITMETLKVGDMVKTGPSTYSPVWMFSHKEVDRFAEFVRITFDDETTLTMTADHYVHLPSGLKTAGSFVPGDRMMSGSNSYKTVVSSSIVQLKGVYNARTLDGTIVVDDVVASIYTALIDPTLSYLLALPFETIYRLAGFNLLGSFYEGEQSNLARRVYQILPKGSTDSSASWILAASASIPLASLFALSPKSDF